MIKPSETPTIRDQILRLPNPLPRLRKAPLYWVSQEMGELVNIQHQQMPEWSPSMCRPTSSGLMVIPIKNLPSSPTMMVVFTWVTEEDGSITVVAYDLFGGHVIESMRINLPPDLTLPLPVDEVPAIQGETLMDKMLGVMKNEGGVNGPITHTLLQQMGCAWILMQQPTLSTQRRVKGEPRHGVKRKKKIDLVQYITLRTIPSKTKVREEPPSHEGRGYHVRWWVKGHWRQQAVGVGRKLRKPIYIAPHIRGPEDAPLKTERVNKWTR